MSGEATPVAQVYRFWTSGINGWFSELRPGDALGSDDFGDRPTVHVVPRALWDAYAAASSAARIAENELDDWIDAHESVGPSVTGTE